MALAVVTRIPSLMEAHIAVAALRASGIDAQLFDGNFGAVESPVIESLGGFRVMAPEAQVADARETLKALRAAPPLPTGEDDETWPWGASLTEARPPRGHAMRWLALLLLSAPFLLWVLARLLGLLTLSEGRP